MAGRTGTNNPDEGGLRVETGLPSANQMDPTPRTMQQVLRENFWLRELLETRLNGMDKALLLLQAFADRTPTTMDVQHQVLQLREVAMVKFVENEKAIEAAFAASKEVVVKTEDQFRKLFDTIGSQVAAIAKATDDKISDIKERITIMESKTSVSDPSTSLALANLERAVQQMRTVGDVGQGAAAGKAALWALIVGVLGLVFGLGSTVALFMKMAN